MSVEQIHLARRQLLITQEQLIAAYKKASDNWPEMPTIAAQSALCQAHHALLPVAFVLGPKFEEQFRKNWDAAINAVQEKQRKPGRNPVKPRRLINSQVISA